ncbi:hypothetical protein QVD17_09069 [Tagetes erecta]|uniref:HAT C-terminal dimerisation domain-containing protein n=1 Tax=Tagetes erecta TaxID=13708 RepID=A0AAD8L598_TARER|nr:hypothetical protein QVD17_09069 [Tagetes erecta]
MFGPPLLLQMSADVVRRLQTFSCRKNKQHLSASGRVLNDHRSSLSKITVEALICTKDWLYGDICSNQVSVDELTEDIISLDISGESNASNTVNNPKAPTSNASSSVACSKQ